MVPLVGAIVDRFSLEVGVGPRLVPHLGFLAVKVVVDHGEVVVPEYPAERMELGEVQKTPGPDQLCDHPGPAADVRQPVESPEPGVDHVEVASAEGAYCAVDVGLYEGSVQAELGGQPPRLLYRRSREIQPHHPGAATGPA